MAVLLALSVALRTQTHDTTQLSALTVTETRAPVPLGQLAAKQCHGSVGL